MIIVYGKSTWVKKKIFTQVEKHMQILEMFRIAQLSSRIFRYLDKF